MSGDLEHEELRARAHEVVARVRFARWSTLRGDALTALVAVLLPAVPVALALLTRFEPRRVLHRALKDSALANGLVVVALGFVVLGMIALLIAAGTAFAAGVYGVTLAVVTGPWEAVVWRERRRAEALLLEGGAVPPGWAGGRAWRREALARLSREDPGLALADGGLALRPSPRLRCDGCGAWLRAMGRGLWRCAHCGRERYDELPQLSAALEAARRTVGSAARAGSRWGLLSEALRREAHDGLRSFRWGGRIAAGVFGLAALGDLTWLLTGKPMNPLSVLALVGLTLGMLPICGAWAWGLYQVAAAAVSVGPGVRSYDDALAQELVRVVVAQGRIGVDELAAHLGVPVAMLRAQVARLEAYGRLPLFRDREGGALLALHVRGSATNECPACGGALEVVAGARQRCAHCGGLALGRVA